MNGQDGPSIIWGVVCALMLVSSLAARRLPLGQVAKMLLAWLAIFSLLFIVFGYRNELKSIWRHAVADITGNAGQSVSGKTVQLKRRDDGHFWVRANVNGHDIDFMIDSGATVTALSTDAARAVGAQIDQSGFPVAIDTANGTVMARRGSISKLQLETIQMDDLPITVSDNLGEINLLGMNFLDRLDKWNVQGDVMTLEP